MEEAAFARTCFGRAAAGMACSTLAAFRKAAMRWFKSAKLGAQRIAKTELIWSLARERKARTKIEHVN
jgi:hypothetical protein